MPAFLTHWRVLIETAKRSSDAGNNLGSLIIDAGALRRRAPGWVAPPQTPPAGAVWDTGPLPSISFNFPGSDISAMAYLGALAPGIHYFQRGNFRKKVLNSRQHNGLGSQAPARDNVCWADLLHFHRSGDVLLAFLEHIAAIPSPALRSQALAFAMGYLSHIATDIALNPCLNALAAAYHSSALPGRFAAALNSHFYVELCLDEYVAQTYFGRPLYNWIHQPWDQYIEPVASSCLIPSAISAQVLNLLTNAAEVTYGLTEEQSKNFHQDYLAGLQRLRDYLAGSGIFRLLVLNALARKRKDDPIIAAIAEKPHGRDELNFEQAISYAIRLSEHLCRRAIAYYSALRNSAATASERNKSRFALCEDLRNWNLDTGYNMDITFDEQITLHLLHNWVHFARLWEDEKESVAYAPHY
jgi:hypothetical protein